MEVNNKIKGGKKKELGVDIQNLVQIEGEEILFDCLPEKEQLKDCLNIMALKSKNYTLLPKM